MPSSLSAAVAVGVLFPRRWSRAEPLTPVSRARVPFSMEESRRSRRRPPSTPPRERRRFVMTGVPSADRDSSQDGGVHVSGCPGPATTAPRERWCGRWMAISRHPEPAPVLPAEAVEADARFAASPRVHEGGVTHRRERGARSPFTRPCRSFWSACAELVRDQASPADFCNYDRRAGNQTRALRSSRGGRPRPPSSSLASRISLAGAVTRGEPRSVRSDERRARVGGPSEGRVPEHLQRCACVGCLRIW